MTGVSRRCVRALGWDMENRAGLIQKEHGVEIESATQIIATDQQLMRSPASFMA